MFLHLLCHSVHGGRAPVQGGSCPEGSLSRGGSLSVGGLCRVGSLSRGVGALSRVVSVQGGLCQGDPPPPCSKERVVRILLEFILVFGNFIKIWS